MLGSNLLGAQTGRQANRAPRQVMERWAGQRPAVGRLLTVASIFRPYGRLQRRKQPLVGDSKVGEHLTRDRWFLAEGQQQMLTTKPVVSCV